MGNSFCIEEGVLSGAGEDARECDIGGKNSPLFSGQFIPFRFGEGFAVERLFVQSQMRDGVGDGREAPLQ